MANEHDYSGPGEARDPWEPQIQAAMDSLQVGDWEQAVAALRELAEDYPDSREIEHALQEALFRARWMPTRSSSRAAGWCRGARSASMPVSWHCWGCWP